MHCTGIVSLETAELAKIPDDVVLDAPARARLRRPARRRGAPRVGEPARATHPGHRSRRLRREPRRSGASAPAPPSGPATPRARRRAGRRRGDACDARRPRAGPCLRARVRRVLPVPAAARTRAAGPGRPHRPDRGRGGGRPTRSSCTSAVSMAPDGFVWTVPIARDGRARLKVGVMATGDAGAYLRAFLERPEIRARGCWRRTEPPIRRLLPLQPIARTYARAPAGRRRRGRLHQAHHRRRHLLQPAHRLAGRRDARGGVQSPAGSTRRSWPATSALAGAAGGGAARRRTGCASS